MKKYKNLIFVVNTILALILAIGFGYEFQRASRVEHRKEQWKTLLEHIGAAVIAVNEDGIIEKWSDGAEDLLGWKMEDVIGNELSMIFPDSSYTKKHYSGFHNKYLQEKLKHGEIIETNGELLKKSGEKVNIRVTVRAIVNGKVTYIANMVENNRIIYVKPRPNS